MSEDRRTRLKRWLESGEINLQPLTFAQRELWEASPIPPPDVSNHICAFIEVRGVLAQQDCEAAMQHGGRTTQVWDAIVRDRTNGKTIALFRCTQMILYPRG